MHKQLFGKTILLVSDLRSNAFFFTDRYFFVTNLAPQDSLNFKSAAALITSRTAHATTHHSFSFFFKLFFVKIRFRGKGYKLFKVMGNTIITQLGFSHCLFKQILNCSIKVVAKLRFYFFGLNFFLLRAVTNSFVSKKKFNIFTGNGLRFSKQLVYKKTGKVSTYF